MPPLTENSSTPPVDDLSHYMQAVSRLRQENDRLLAVIKDARRVLERYAAPYSAANDAIGRIDETLLVMERNVPV